MRAEEGKAGRKCPLPLRKCTALLRMVGRTAGLMLPRSCLLVAASTVSVAALGAAQPADYAQQVQQHAEREIVRYAKSRGWVNYEYTVNPWVPAGQPECRQAVVVEPASENARRWGRVPYLIRCVEPQWEIRARAEVSLTVPVVTARRNISKGETLNHSTLVLAKRDLARVHGDFVTDAQQLSGQRARRALRSGQVVSLNQAAPPLLVERGDQVLIRVRAGEVRASMTGEALQNGSKGEGIRVRNHSSGKVITAWVAEKGIVETRF